MSTIVIYNGVTLTNVLTRRFLQTLVYDESNTDPYYHKFTITVQGYVHTIDSTTVNISTNKTTANGGTVASNEITLRQKLLEARKDFEMTIGGEKLLKVSHGGTTAGAQQDANNGPKPISVEVTKFLGSTSAGGLMQVTFEIELCVVDCSQDNNQTGVLSNRWSASDAIDNNFYTTRTITGRLRVKHMGVNPQLFRNLVIPHLQRGFKRESITCTTSVDGLTMEYTVIDVEKFAASPSPATEWSGTYTLSTSDGINNHGEVAIMMSGPRNADKVHMLEACALIIQSKLFVGRDHVYIETAQIVDHLHENVIEIRVQTLDNPGTNQPLIKYALGTVRLGKPLTSADIPGYDQTKWPVPKRYGTTTLTNAFVCYLQSPCDDQHVLSTGIGGGAGGDVPPLDDTNVYTYEGVLATDSEVEGNYSASQAANVYTHYSIDSDYITDPGALQLPIAASSVATIETAKFISLHSATTRKIVRISAERLGDWPQIPPANTFAIGTLRAIPLKISHRGRAPRLSADRKTQIFSIDLVYEYAFNRAPLPGEALSMGSLPWDTTIIAGNALPASALTAGIIES